jgi:choice-of-anchor B domain-containing protein
MVQSRSLRIVAFAMLTVALTATAVNAHALLDLLGLNLHDHRSHVHKDEARDPAAVAASQAALPEGRLSGVACANGQAGPFSCSGVDLLSFVPATEFAGMETDPLTSDDFGPDGVAGLSDLWGWTDPEAGADGVHDEYVILGKTNGVAFFRVTDPYRPEFLGELPNHSPLQLVWHDVKVHADHAFIVSESAGHGMQVFDLRQLRDVSGEPRVFAPTSHYPLSFSAHNIAINEDTATAYIVGGNVGIVGQEPCSLHMVDISNPAAPTFVGCWVGERGQLGSFRPVEYVHDAQCTIYRGPDADHQGKEICFLADEINISIVDVTDKSSPVLLSQTEYTDVAYSHQGWLTDDHGFFLLGDELDETDYGMNTRTVVFDVRDLDGPRHHFDHLHQTVAIDHNMYTVGPVLYQSNYSAGLRVLDTTGVRDAKRLTEIGFFDTYPADDDDPVTEFSGTWSNYPYFESGTIAVSGIDEGLFLVKVQDRTLKQVGKGGKGKGGPKAKAVPLGDPVDQTVYFSIGCERAEDGTTCARTVRSLSAEPGESSVGTIGDLTPLNEAIYLLDGTERTQQYGADATLADRYRLRSGQPIEGQITLQSFSDAGAGLTTVYVELSGLDADNQRIKLGDATVTQLMPPGGPTVFEFTIELEPDLDGVVVEGLSAGVAVRGANLLAGFTDGEGGSFFTLPHYTQ